jgi:hypothetical protein
VRLIQHRPDASRLHFGSRGFQGVAAVSPPVEEDHIRSASRSPDIRRRFQQYVTDRLSGREAARRKVKSAAIGALLARRVRATAPLSPAKSGRPAGLDRASPARGTGAARLPGRHRPDLCQNEHDKDALQRPSA